jgi:hypothetical protein
MIERLALGIPPVQGVISIIVPFLLPSGRRMGPAMQGRKISIDTKVFDS